MRITLERMSVLRGCRRPNASSTSASHRYEGHHFLTLVYSLHAALGWTNCFHGGVYAWRMGMA